MFRSSVLIASVPVALAMAGAAATLAPPADAAAGRPVAGVRARDMAVVLATSNSTVGPGATVVLSAWGTHAAGGRRLVRYRFDTGDGLAPQTGTHLPRFLHHYWLRAGRYPVTLTVYDNRGTSVSAGLTVTVS